MQDSHCHLDFPAYDRDRELVVRRALDAGVSEILVPGVSPALWARSSAMLRYDCVRVGVGLHPMWIEGPCPRLRGQLRGALQGQGVVAIGECGLHKGGAPLPLQLELLRVHIELALEHKLPLLLHCVGRHGALLELLTSYGQVPGVLHSYSGSPEMVSRYAALGLHFSFGGVLTWPEARKAKLSLAQVPPGRLLLESDGPDQPLHRKRGQADPRSEPADILALGAQPDSELFAQAFAEAVR